MDLGGDLEADAEQFAGRLVTRGHGGEVEPGREATGSTGEHHRRGLGPGPMERGEKVGGQREGDGVGLAVVHGDDRDAVAQFVGDH